MASQTGANAHQQPRKLRRDRLHKLRTLINDSLDVYEQELDASGIDELDLDSLESHPFTDMNADFFPSARMYESSRILLSSLTMLHAMVEDPADRVLTLIKHGHETQAVYACVQWRIADHLASAADPAVGMPIAELGAKTGLDAGKLGRYLRLLTSQYIFKETQEGVFANNHLSRWIMTSECPVTSYIWHATKYGPISQLHTPPTFYVDPIQSAKATADLPASRGRAFPQVNVSSDGTDGNEGKVNEEWKEIAAALPDRPSRRAMGFPDDVPWYTFIAGPGLEVDQKHFARGMQGWSHRMLPSIVNDFPWTSLPEGTVLVDVGSGQGSLTSLVLKRAPHLRAILQDLPSMIKLAPGFFEKNNPAALASQSVTFEPYDFFTPQPHSGDHLVYIMKAILHNWPDKDCVSILRNLRSAMTPASKLLIFDLIMQPATAAAAGSTTASDSGLKAELQKLPGHADNSDIKDTAGSYAPIEVPWPLARNLGSQSRFAMHTDMQMLMFFGSQQRTALHLSSLLEQAGLEIARFWPVRTNRTWITEVRVRQ